MKSYFQIQNPGKLKNFSDIEIYFTMKWNRKKPILIVLA